MHNGRVHFHGGRKVSKMRMPKGVTRREFVAGVLFSLALISATVMLLRGLDYAVFVLLAVVGACQLLVLRTIERGQAIERRKLDKVQKRLEKLGDAEQIRAVGALVEESFSKVETKLEVEPHGGGHEESDFPVYALDEFIFEMDQLDESVRGLPLSRLVSLHRVLRVVRPDTIVSGVEVATALQRYPSVENIEYRSFEELSSVRGSDRRIVVIVDAAHAYYLPRLVLESNIYVSGILLMDLDDWAMPTNHFAEVLPVDFLVGVRFFYPRDRVIDAAVWDMKAGSSEREDG